MKTKLVLWICALTVIFAACSKSESQDPLDCMRVENGVAVLDDCGECHRSYIYNDSTHRPTYINDTIGLVLEANEELVLAGGSAYINNPYSAWNMSCTDCMGILNGGAVARGDSCLDCNGILDGSSRTDDCGDCWQAYLYSMDNHVVILYLDDTTDVTAGPGELLVIPGDPGDRNWNSGCDPDTIIRP